jgi:hypothetical protein
MTGRTAKFCVGGPHFEGDQKASETPELASDYSIGTYGVIGVLLFAAAGITFRFVKRKPIDDFVSFTEEDLDETDDEFDEASDDINETVISVVNVMVEEGEKKN